MMCDPSGVMARSRATGWRLSADVPDVVRSNRTTVPGVALPAMAAAAPTRAVCLTLLPGRRGIREGPTTSQASPSLSDSDTAGTRTSALTPAVLLDAAGTVVSQAGSQPRGVSYATSLRVCSASTSLMSV